MTSPSHYSRGSLMFFHTHQEDNGNERRSDEMRLSPTCMCDALERVLACYKNITAIIPETLAKTKHTKRLSKVSSAKLCTHVQFTSKLPSYRHSHLP